VTVEECITLLSKIASKNIKNYDYSVLQSICLQIFSEHQNKLAIKNFLYFFLEIITQMKEKHEQLEVALHQIED